MKSLLLAALRCCCLAAALVAAPVALAEAPAELRPWLETEQAWLRDTAGPVLSLGEAGAFDDAHIFAPAVGLENEAYQLWYCGSRGEVGQRVFRLGLATSSDGHAFRRYSRHPVYALDDEQASILTPTLLRDHAGITLREDGRLRMWFSSTRFAANSDRHTLHEATSEDGITWSRASEPQLENVYAPTVIKTGRHYQMWFVDVAQDPWIIRHAWSADGRKWRVTPEPCLTVDQQWEKGRLFYPTVIRRGGVYLMWYGSYWSQRPQTTALGFAASIDGLKWYKHPSNPVFRPEPQRPWESHYVTSQSIVPLPEGGLRMWYASRKAPPFVNKYFALNTAVWTPKPELAAAAVASSGGGGPLKRLLAIAGDRAAFDRWQADARDALREMLGIPAERVPLDAESRGQMEWDGIIVEKWVFTSEAGSRVPAVLYRPKHPAGSMPAVVLTFGHGGSKSQWQYNYAGQLYARLGLACLALDPIGEEERHNQGRLGTRAHDPKPVSDRADRAGRLIMGKLVFDTMRGIDFLVARDDIDSQRIGVSGNSLGGAKAAWMASLEPRIKMAIVSGWAYDDICLRTKYCTQLPNQRMREALTWTEYAALSAPDCAVLVMNGDADWVIDRDDDGSAWRGTRNVVRDAGRVFQRLGAGNVQAWWEPGGGHRPYFVYKDALLWIHQHLGTPSMTVDQIRQLPTINSGQWCDAQGIELEKLYGTPLHQRGATLPHLNLRPIPRELLSCLKPGEQGTADFTVDGWLQQIEAAPTAGDVQP